MGTHWREREDTVCWRGDGRAGRALALAVVACGHRVRTSKFEAQIKSSNFDLKNHACENHANRASHRIQEIPLPCVLGSFESEAEGNQGETNRRWDGWMDGNRSRAMGPAGGGKGAVRRRRRVLSWQRAARVESDEKDGGAGRAEGFLESNHGTMAVAHAD